MTDNYAKIVQNNLDQLYANLPQDLEQRLPGHREGNAFCFNAFGEPCRLSPQGITLADGSPVSPVKGILISLYARHVTSEVPLLTPFKAFREIPDSTPYVGAFTARTEQALVPHVGGIKPSVERLVQAFDGQDAPVHQGGDFSFTLFPLPKIALCYIFYEADDEFPPSVTCLFSGNAHRFLPVDGLADVGEYTSRKLLTLI